MRIELTTNLGLYQYPTLEIPLGLKVKIQTNSKISYIRSIFFAMLITIRAEKGHFNQKKLLDLLTTSNIVHENPITGRTPSRVLQKINPANRNTMVFSTTVDQRHDLLLLCNMPCFPVFVIGAINPPLN